MPREKHLLRLAFLAAAIAAAGAGGAAAQEEAPPTATPAPATAPAAPNEERESRELTRTGTRDYATPLNERERAQHLLSRLTFGATPELIEEVVKKGIDAWLDEQFKGNLPEPATLAKALAERKTLAYSAAQAIGELNPRDQTLSQAERNRLRNLAVEEVREAALLFAVFSPNQVREVLCDFFRNHFAIDLRKDACKYFGPSYDREVIRAHVFGKFGGMLVASAKHPGMLVFLDNFLSRRPLEEYELDAIQRGRLLSKRRRDLTDEDRARALEQREIAAQKGLNENYARELLELHTLGVDNYYTQQDVIQVAQALTGWTQKGGLFYFDKNMHVPGDKTFLGVTIRNNPADGIKEGEQVLNILIHHPGTARFLSWKLCRWLVNDDPPDDLVKRVAAVFRASSGDIPTVVRAIVKDKEFFNPANYQAKFKRPFEFTVSALRVSRAEVADPKRLLGALALMNEPIYQCDDPTGFYDQAEAWRDAGAMATRWQIAVGLAVGAGKAAAAKVGDSFWKEITGDTPAKWIAQVAARVCPSGITPRTEKAIRDALVERGATSDVRFAGPLILGLLLGSPEFQKQ
ncbi:MAG: DUF1800 domain-containing protein [Planctomycetes bacterium]|nr:DUF1800 domain-containing protein [Planctomycetota bacterium]